MIFARTRNRPQKSRSDPTQYVAFIRAINVAGHARVKMTSVKDAFVAAGCADVRTYIQSGNVVFDAPSTRSEAVFRRVRLALRELIGEEPGIMFRTVSQLEAIIKKAPFKLGDPRLKLYVVFLAERPRRKPALPFRSAKEELDAVAMNGLEVFVVSRRKPSGFYGFPNSFVEQALAVAATSRNLSTLTKLVEFCGKEVPSGSSRKPHATITRSPRAPQYPDAGRRPRAGRAGSRFPAS